MNNEKKAIQEKIMSMIADIYFDRESINCNQLQDIALFLYQNAKYGPSGTKQFAACLNKLIELIWKNSQENPKLFYDEKGKMKALSDIDDPNIHDEFPEIAKLFIQIKKCIHPMWIKFYLFLDEAKKRSQIIKMANSKFNEAFHQKFGYDLITYINFFCNNWLDMHRNSKNVFSYYSTYQNQKNNLLSPSALEVNKEVSNDSVDTIRDDIENLFMDYSADLLKEATEKANATLERLEALYHMTLDENRKAYLQNCIFELNVAIISNDLNSINKEIIFKEAAIENEDIFSKKM